MTLHSIKPNADTLHGTFSQLNQPVLEINSGETVRFQTLDAAWNVEPRTSTRYEEKPKQFEPRNEDGHALCGPVAIRGAMPGMTLAIEIGEIVVGSWGWTAAGGWPHPVNVHLGLAHKGTFLLWALDAEKGIGRNQHNHIVKLSPFMGVMGMPPAEAGHHSTVPPRPTGGNIDCKELIAGSTLYLPIAVEGGLFSTGDGHARQGDGESSVTAIECPMERVDLTFHVLPDVHLTMPIANTPAGWLTFGLNPDLNQATLQALEEMVKLLMSFYVLDKLEATALASVVVDLRVTQIANGVCGVHAVLPHDSVEGLELRESSLLTRKLIG